VIVGAVRIAVVADVAGRVRERIPDRAPSPVFIDGALDLVGARRSGAGLIPTSSAFAGIPAISSAEKAASFAKCRRENLPNMDPSDSL